MGRRTSLATLAGEQVDDVPGQRDLTLLRLHLTQLVPTRFNPRTNFGTQEELAEFGKILAKRQLQPAVVVSRSAYLKLWPDEAEHVGVAPYVIANGERRYRGSLAANLTHLNVVQQEDVAASRADFLDAVLSENIDRKNLDPIEQASGVDTMVRELGSARAVATHYGRHETWVSQQRKLLKLVPDLQRLVSSGVMPVRVARDLAGLPTGEQAEAWHEEEQRRQSAKAIPRTRAARPAPQEPEPAPQPPTPRESAARLPVDGTAAEPPAPSSDEEAQPSRTENFPAVKVATPAPEDTAAPVVRPSPTGPPVRRREPLPDLVTVGAVPWGDPRSVARIVTERMDAEARRQLVKLLSEDDDQPG